MTDNIIFSITTPSTAFSVSAPNEYDFYAGISSIDPSGIVFETGIYEKGVYSIGIVTNYSTTQVFSIPESIAVI
jgi:hypothetical protein